MVTKSTLNFFVTKSIMVALWSNSQNHVNLKTFVNAYYVINKITKKIRTE